MSRGQKSEIRMAEGRVGKVGGCDGRVSLFSGGFVSAVAAVHYQDTCYRLQVTDYGLWGTGLRVPPATYYLPS